MQFNAEKVLMMAFVNLFKILAAHCVCLLQNNVNGQCYLRAQYVLQTTTNIEIFKKSSGVIQKGKKI